MIFTLQEINSEFGAPWDLFINEILDIKTKRFGYVECTICIEKCAENSAESVITRCGHTYHKKCLQKWLGAKNICPNCKKLKPWIGFTPI